MGEKRALVLSLFFTGIASVWVGMATTFSEALMARFFQGFSNCISGCVKRAAINARFKREEKRSEALSTSDGSSTISRNPSSSLEELGNADPQAIVLAVMWWGSALGPIVGGLLSDPRIIGEWWISSSTHPFFWSNLCSALLCWLSMTCAVVLIRESSSPSQTNTEEQRPLLMEAPRPRRVENYLIATSDSLWQSFRKLWSNNEAAKHHLLAYWSFSFVVVCLDEGLPIFLITSIDTTGLGLSESHIGALLSVAGFAVALGHHVALERFFDGSKNGTYRVVRTGAILGSVPAAFIPISIVLNNMGGGPTKDSLLLGTTTTSFVFLVLTLIFLRGWAGLYFSFIGMATGQTLRVVQKDEAARIMTLGALFFRSIAPMVVGGVLSICFSRLEDGIIRSTGWDPSWTVWIVIGLLFGLAAASISFLLDRHSGDGILTDKQRAYFLSRLKAMTSFKDDWNMHDESSKSTFTRWMHSAFYGPRVQKRLKSEADTRIEKARETNTKESFPRRIKWAEHIVRPGVDFDAISFFILGTHRDDKSCVPHVLTPPLMNALQKYLPMHCAQSNFWLKYSLLRDGATMHSLEAKAGLARYNIMAIETLNGDVFGCFMNKPWVSSNNHYRHADESFLWRMTKRRPSQEESEDTPESCMSMNDSLIDVYPRVGDNELCQLFGDHKIACGGGIVDGTGDGFGIVLNEDLLSGSTSPCQTYDNPSLVNGGDHKFEVANIEIWSLTPYMFVADAEKSEKALQFIKDNSYETPSSTSPWSNFL